MIHDVAVFFPRQHAIHSHIFDNRLYNVRLYNNVDEWPIAGNIAPTSICLYAVRLRSSFSCRKV